MQERVWFDLKATYGPAARAEIAKDVAAFANAIGGAIIVGAQEGPTEPDYSSPLSDEWAAKLEGQFDEAVRDFCRPSPTVHVRAIPVPDMPAKVVLVANVEPAIDQPIAARHESDQNTWRFPLRVGRHTEYIFPEQLPLYMDSKARRAKLLLLRILQGGGKIDLFTIPSGTFSRGSIRAPDPFLVESVDKDANGAVVVRHVDDAFRGQAVAVPIDDIESIWQQTSGSWAVRVSGCLEEFRTFDGAGPELAYVPPRTFVVSPLEKPLDAIDKQLSGLSRAISGTLVVQHHERREPSHDAISRRAHQLWRLREQHGTPGSAENDWLRARRELLRAGKDD